jgi:hypothetical protein
VRIQAGKWNLVLRRPKCNGKNQLGLKTSQAKEELGRKKEKTICSLACGGDEISNQQSVGRVEAQRQNRAGREPAAGAKQDPNQWKNKTRNQIEKSKTKNAPNARVQTRHPDLAI